MEHGTGECVKEQSHTEMTIKTEVEEATPCTAHVDIKVDLLKKYRIMEIDVDHLKQEPGLVQLVKSKPVLLLNEEILNSGQGTDELQGAPATSTYAIASRTSVAAGSVEQGQLIHVKEQLEDTDLDIEPTVLQHMDSRYRTNQTVSNDIKQENTLLNIDPEEVQSRIDDDQLACSEVRDETNEDSQNDTEDDNYHCDRCMKTFQTKRKFMGHCKNMHGTEQYKCRECNRELKSKASLWCHISSVHSKQQNECDVCKKTFKTKKLLAAHILRVHSHIFLGSHSLLYQCQQCQKMFSCKCDLNAHYKRAHGTEYLKCTKCNRVFKCNSSLQRHIKNVHNKQHYECVLCKTRCKCMEKLRAHVARFHGHRSAEIQQSILSDSIKNFELRWNNHQHKTQHDQSTHPTTDSTSFALNTSTQQQVVGVVKSEPADGELELGPVVFQHMDFNYRPLKEEPQHN